MKNTCLLSTIHSLYVQLFLVGLQGVVAYPRQSSGKGQGTPWTDCQDRELLKTKPSKFYVLTVIQSLRLLKMYGIQDQVMLVSFVKK